jgi:hypothetical protein
MAAFPLALQVFKEFLCVFLALLGGFFRIINYCKLSACGFFDALDDLFKMFRYFIAIRGFSASKETCNYQPPALLG